MDSIDTLPNADLRAGSPLSDAFLARSLTTLADACRWVKDLPYGSNSRLDHPMLIFEEGRGTCFTKHGAIVRLAGELGVDIHKNIGFYRLTEDIITGVDAVLRPHGLAFVPTIHCFLEHGPYRVDLTEGNQTGKNKDVVDFDFVVRVEADSSREELERHYAAHFPAYVALQPRLGELDRDTVREITMTCHRLASCRCVEPVRPAPVAILGIR